MRTGTSPLFRGQNAWSWPVKCDLALLLDEWSVCWDRDCQGHWNIPILSYWSMKNIRWKIAIESGTSHVLSLRSPIILFPLDSECRRKVSYIHSWEAVTSPMTTTALFLLVPSIMAHHFLLQQSLAGAWTVLKTGLAPCLSAQWFVSLGFYLVNQVNHVLKHLRCFSFCNIFLFFCQLSDCVFSSLTEEYLE